VPFKSLWKVRTGDYTTEAGLRLLEERSPLNCVDRIVRPLLIGQGANNVRVKASESWASNAPAPDPRWGWRLPGRPQRYCRA
jgi:hypothetical protein